MENLSTRKDTLPHIQTSQIIAFALAWALNALNFFGLIILSGPEFRITRIGWSTLLVGCLLWLVGLLFLLRGKSIDKWFLWSMVLIWTGIFMWLFRFEPHKSVIMSALNIWLLFVINRHHLGQGVGPEERGQVSIRAGQLWEPVEIRLSFIVIIMGVLAAGYQLFSDFGVRISLLLVLGILLLITIISDAYRATRPSWKILLWELSPLAFLIFFQFTWSLVITMLIVRQSFRLMYLMSRIQRVRSAVLKLFSVPAQLLTVSFLVIIVVGTIFLTFPVSTERPGGIAPIDALFTATSATCVTGLIVLDTPHDFTFFGQLIILFLIQLGGLGFMTVSTFGVLIVGKKLGLPHQWALSAILEEKNPQSLFRFIRFIVMGTLALEIIGAVILSYGMFRVNPCLKESIWFGIFHAISAFCNAGFALQSDNLESFYAQPVIIVPVILLFIAGGMGFTVLYSLWDKLVHPGQGHYLSLHVKAAVLGTLVLLIGGSGLFLMLEWSNVLQDQSLSQKVLNAVFQSATPRTAGFNTVPIDSLTSGSQFLMILFMFIGACPGSTGGGIKITTFIIILLTVVSIIRGGNEVEFLHRRIPLSTVFKATAIITLSLIAIALAFFVLLLTQSASFGELLFETVSAFGTVGLSCGITSQLTSFGKLVIIGMMFLGRLGPLTLALTLEARETRHHKLPYGDISVG